MGSFSEDKLRRSSLLDVEHVDEEDGDVENEDENEDEDDDDDEDKEE